MERYVSEDSLDYAREILNRWPYRKDPDVPKTPAPSHYNNPGGCTLEECARELGITKEGVRQIELRALRKLRKLLTAGRR